MVFHSSYHRSFFCLHKFSKHSIYTPTAIINAEIKGLPPYTPGLQQHCSITSCLLGTNLCAMGIDVDAITSAPVERKLIC